MDVKTLGLTEPESLALQLQSRNMNSGLLVYKAQIVNHGAELTK